MTQQDFTLSRLGAYLSEWTPAAREMIRRALDRASRKGTLTAEAEAIFLALGQQQDPEPNSPPLIQPPALTPETFFAPYWLSARDDDVNLVLPGRINRASFAQLWAYIQREGAPSLIAAWTAQPAMTAIAIENSLDCLRRSVFAALRQAIAEHAATPQATQRLTGRVGGPRAFADLQTLLNFERRRKAITNTLRAIPKADEDDPDTILQGVAALARHLDHMPDDAVWLAATLIASPATAARVPMLAVALAGSNLPIQIRISQGAPFMVATLGELSRNAQQIATRCGDVARTSQVVTMLRDWIELNAAILAAVDLDEADIWRAEIGAMRTILSAALTAQLEQAAHAVERLGSGRDGASNLPIANHGVALLVLADRAKEALAVSAVVAQARETIEYVLVNATSRIISNLNLQKDADQATALRMLEDLGGLCAQIFGEDYLTLLRRRQSAALVAA